MHADADLSMAVEHLASRWETTADWIRDNLPINDHGLVPGGAPASFLRDNPEAHASRPIVG